MRNFKTEGIIIKRRDFKDADRIITVLTRDHGKIVIRASGIRRIPSRRSPHVELLNHCTLTLYNGRAFPVLTEAQMLESFSSIKEDLEKIGLAYHLCELVDGLCPENQENRQVFELLKNTLSRLSQPVILRLKAEESLADTSFSEKSSEIQRFAQDDNNEIVHNFQIELLSILGYLNKQNFLTESLDMDHFVENILERKLKSKRIFARL